MSQATNSRLSSRVRRYQHDNDEERARFLRQEAFRLPLLEDLWQEEGWVMEEGQTLQAALLSPRLGHFLGGRAVPTRGITGVVVAPEARGLNKGEVLMRAVLEEMRAEGASLSSLTPSTLPFYRRLGYEVAGTINCIRIPCADLVSQTSLIAEPIDLEGDFDQLRSCYETFARRTSGLIDRDVTWWKRRTLRLRGDEDLYCYGVWEDGKLSGYCLYSQVHEPTFGNGFLQARGYHYSLVCRDLVWLTDDAARALLAFAGGNRPLGGYLAWYGSLQDPLHLMSGSLNRELQWSFPWMVRVVDIERALSSRGFPAHVKAAVNFTIYDPILTGNKGSWRLELDAGESSVRAIEKAPLTLSIGAFSTLFTGHLCAHQLAHAGYVEGADDSQLTALGEIFRVSSPWAMEVF